MATVQERLTSLINAANTITGKADTDMTTATQSLIAGFGGGGSSTKLASEIVERSIVNVDLPEARAVANASFGNAQNLKTAKFKNLTGLLPSSPFGVGNNAFENDTALERFEADFCEGVGRFSFRGCTALTVTIFRNTAEIAILHDSRAYQDSAVSNGTGYIYVPRALVETYKSASNWSGIALQIRAIEDYPEITGG